MLAFETCFLQLTIITVENEGKIALDSQKRICFYAKETSDPDLYREFKTSVLRFIKVFRYLTPVIEHLKPRLWKRGKEVTGVFEKDILALSCSSVSQEDTKKKPRSRGKEV